MRRVYEELELGDFEAVRPAIEKYFAGKKDYKTNRYEMTPELRDRDHPPLGDVHQAVRLCGGRSRQIGSRQSAARQRNCRQEPVAASWATVSSSRRQASTRRDVARRRDATLAG